MKLTRGTILTATLLLLVIFSACVMLDQEASVQHMPIEFNQHCAPCHGDDLRGEIAQSLLDGSWQFGSRRHDIFRSIKYGYPHHGMPSWAGILSDDQIDTLVDWLRAEEERLGLNNKVIPDTIETQDYTLDVEVVIEGLETPWSMQFLNEDKALITEREGRLRVWKSGVLLPDTVVGLPPIRSGGQGGLMDVAIDPKFEQNGWIYLAISTAADSIPGEDRLPAMTSIVRGRLDQFAWVDSEVLFEAPHETYRTTIHHFGGRIVFDPEGFLYFTIGDRGTMEDAQDLSKPNGKIHRLYPDGRIPPSNPFVNQSGAMPSIFSLGHRNQQGLAVHPETGHVWSTEHGPLGGDELNLIRSGRNYGWPVISYGINYNGDPITDKIKQEGMEQPILYWKPSIAACGLEFYQGDQFPLWNNRLLAGALKFEEVQLLNVVDDRVIYHETILKNAGRVRDITIGPDGAIYVVLNRPDLIIRLQSKHLPLQ